MPLKTQNPIPIDASSEPFARDPIPIDPVRSDRGWCWAACALMIHRVVYPDSALHRVCEVVGIWFDEGLTCCNADNPCGNRPFFTGQTGALFEKLCVRADWLGEQPLLFPEFEKHFASQKPSPMLVLVQTAPAMAHMLIVNGVFVCDGAPMIHFIDPAGQLQGQRPFEDLNNGSPLRWRGAWTGFRPA